MEALWLSSLAEGNRANYVLVQRFTTMALHEFLYRGRYTNLFAHWQQCLFFR